MPSYLPLDRMLGIGEGSTVHLAGQPVDITLKEVELGERPPIEVDVDRRIYTTFVFVNQGTAPVDFEPLAVFAGVPATGRSRDRASIMDPTNPVHLEPDTPESIRWRWRVATNHAVNGATPGETVWLTVNAPIDYTGPYVTISSGSAVFRIDLPGEPPTRGVATATQRQAPTATALPHGTPLSRH